MNHDRKAFEISELKFSDPSKGVFEGLVSTYGNVDLGGDIVDRGAFTKTLAERGSQIPILWQHDQRCPIGLGTLTDTPGGLNIVGRLDLDVEEGARAYSGLRNGYIPGFSIGYDTIKQSTDSSGNRHLQEVRLWEVSVVTFPMNEEAVLTDIKALLEGKAGRVLSAASRAALKQANDHFVAAKKHLHKGHAVLADLVATADDPDADDAEGAEEVRKMLTRINADLKTAIDTRSSAADLLMSARRLTNSMRAAVRR